MRKTQNRFEGLFRSFLSMIEYRVQNAVNDAVDWDETVIHFTELFQKTVITVFQSKSEEINQFLTGFRAQNSALLDTTVLKL